MQTQQTLINWLLEGDVAIQYQCKRDLLGKDDLNLRKRISKEGWGASFLAQRNEPNHWGYSFYQPKWISSHYTLLDLKHMAIVPLNRTVSRLLPELPVKKKNRMGE